MNKKKVNKSWIVAQFNEGKTVKQVLDAINEGAPEGKRLSEEKFKDNCKVLGINLRKKPKPLPVQFIDDTKAEVPVAAAQDVEVVAE